MPSNVERGGVHVATSLLGEGHVKAADLQRILASNLNWANGRIVTNAPTMGPWRGFRAGPGQVYCG
jgi:hypothetical protein